MYEIIILLKNNYHVYVIRIWGITMQEQTQENISMKGGLKKENVHIFMTFILDFWNSQEIKCSLLSWLARQILYVYQHLASRSNGMPKFFGNVNLIFCFLIDKLWIKIKVFTSSFYYRESQIYWVLFYFDVL